MEARILMFHNVKLHDYHYNELDLRKAQSASLKNETKFVRKNSLVIAFSNTTGLVLQRIGIKMAHFSKVLGLSLQICNAILKG